MPHLSIHLCLYMQIHMLVYTETSILLRTGRRRGLLSAFSHEIHRAAVFVHVTDMKAVTFRAQPA